MHLIFPKNFDKISLRMEKYNPQKIEPKWQDFWVKNKIMVAQDSSEKPKKYILDFFPYPSGAGLSVGHCRNYIPTDALARFEKMRGKNVLHPMGWDAFGLPAENYALKENKHPAITTAENIANYKRQLKLIGCIYDWEREINSTDPNYYKWTQWLFLQAYKAGLAYRAKAAQWWCPSCKTILANEQAEAGKCWRCGSEVTKKELTQWYLKITKYADRLLADLNKIDWPEKIKKMQENWIGKSKGVLVKFKIRYPESETNSNVQNTKSKTIEVFTTRPDTLFGATYLVLAPEKWQDLNSKLKIENKKLQSKIQNYIEETKKKREIDRTSEKKEKTGVFTGVYAENPVNGEKIPIWIADYVLPHYGTGAVMCVPAHDQRDFEFAKKFNLPIKQVIRPADSETPKDRAYTDVGVMINSDRYDNMSSPEAAIKITQDLVRKGLAKESTQYKMRDWLVSRQRYWGVPIPIIFCEKCGIVPVPEKDLPVKLPQMKEFKPSGTGKSPLANNPDFVKTNCPKCSGPAERETDTLDSFMCSSWYFLRFVDPKNNHEAFNKEKVKYWLPVDLYVGGAEHAVMHLLYARFFTKVLKDQGFLDIDEFAQRLANQGIVLAPDGRKMSKSLGNVITPDEVIEKYGADALRLYEMFIAPFDQEVAWQEKGLIGCFRFLNRIWQIIIQNAKFKNDKIQPKLHQTVRKVNNDLENLKFNTAVAALMELVNDLEKQKNINQQTLEILLRLLAPFAPHLAEELWEKTGHKPSIFEQAWPKYDEKLITEEKITLVIQVNGKVRGQIEVEPNTNQEKAIQKALDLKKIQKYISNQKQIKKKIFIKNKNNLLLNLVI